MQYSFSAWTRDIVDEAISSRTPFGECARKTFCCHTILHVSDRALFRLGLSRQTVVHLEKEGSEGSIKPPT